METQIAVFTGLLAVFLMIVKMANWGGATSRIRRNLITKSIAESHQSKKINSSLRESAESQRDVPFSSLRENPQGFSWQSIKSCEAQTESRSASWCIKRGAKEAEVLPLFLCKKRNQARLSPKSETAAAVWRVGERGGGAALFAKKSDYINENISIESRRNERVESQSDSMKSPCDSLFSISGFSLWIASATNRLAMTVRGWITSLVLIDFIAKTAGECIISAGCRLVKMIRGHRVPHILQVFAKIAGEKPSLRDLTKSSRGNPFSFSLQESAKSQRDVPFSSLRDSTKAESWQSIKINESSLRENPQGFSWQSTIFNHIRNIRISCDFLCKWIASATSRLAMTVRGESSLREVGTTSWQSILLFYRLLRSFAKTIREWIASVFPKPRNDGRAEVSLLDAMSSWRALRKQLIYTCKSIKINPCVVRVKSTSANVRYILPLLLTATAFGVELNTLCPNNNKCEITTPQGEVTNRSEFIHNIDIAIKTQVTSLINYSTISLGDHNINVSGEGNNLTNLINYGSIITTNESGKVSLKSHSNGHFHNVYNYGFISGGILLDKNGHDKITITNYGTMGGLNGAENSKNANAEITVDNYNLINLYNKSQFSAINKLMIKNYAIKIEQNSQTFNDAQFTDAVNGNKENTSHLYASETNSVTFSDEKSKLILSAGGEFEFEQDYLTDKLILSRKGDSKTADNNHIDASYLTTKDNYLELSTTPTHFQLRLNGAMSEVAILHKANIKTMNLMALQGNSVIFKRHAFAKTSAKAPVKKRLRTAQRAEFITENDTFFYKNGADSAGGISDYGDSSDSAIFLADARTERARRARNLNTRTAPSTTQRRTLSIKSQSPSIQTSTATPTSDKYYFAFAPFVAYNSLGEQNRYNLSGLEYGLVASFSGNINNANALGLHFAFSYDRYADSSDDRHFKDFYIKSFNFNAGLNYKLDLPLLMYIKARADAFYFMNEFGGVPYYYNLGGKPNTLGFGGSVYYGKDFDFGSGGVMSLEAGVDYKGLRLLKELKIIDEFQSKNDTHKAQIYHIPYLELSLGYEKYFGFGLGVSAKVGVRGNPAFNTLKNTLVVYDTATRSANSYDFILDSDKILGYANIGISYKVLDMMDFSVNYGGIFGDKSMSHAGNFAFRIWW